MRFTALLPPPPTPMTSIRADWLGTMPLLLGWVWLMSRESIRGAGGSGEATGEGLS